MIWLVIGGAASGKSAYAEKLAIELAQETGGPLLYLADMLPGGGEAEKRIARHRKNRVGAGFQTVERYTDLKGYAPDPAAVILLEDLGNLLANEMFLKEGNGEEAARQGVLHLGRCVRHLVVVGNEVISDGIRYSGETERYMRSLASIQCQLASEATCVAEVLCGIPYIIKGSKSI